MNRLVIIGNGFDMAHGLKTSYKDFINSKPSVNPYCPHEIMSAPLRGIKFYLV